MPISLVSSSSAVDILGGGNLVVNAPASIVAGNVLVACIYDVNNESITPPSGWSLAHTWAAAGAGRASVFWHVATASEPSTYTFAGLSGFMSGVIAQYYGVNQSNPFDPSGSSYGAHVYASTTSPFITPALTASENGEELICFYGANGANFSTPAGCILIANTGAGSGTRAAMFRGSGPINIGTVAARASTLSAVGTGIALAFLLAPATVPEGQGRATFHFAASATATVSNAASGIARFTFSASATGVHGLYIAAHDTVPVSDFASPPTAGGHDIALVSDSAFAGSTIKSSLTTALVTVQVAAAPYTVPLPPGPLETVTGNHDYEVIVVDQYGLAKGQIASAVPTEIRFVLDDIGEATIDFWIQDPTAKVLDPTQIPGGLEIQIWRDQQLFFWGVPTSASYDASQVHLTVSDLLWYFGQRIFGPNPLNLLQNPSFELGPTDPGTGVGAPYWGEHNLLHHVEVIAPSPHDNGPPTLDGTYIAGMANERQGIDCYMNQHVPFETGATAVTYDLIAWAYKPIESVPPNYVYPLQFASRGLYIAAVVNGDILLGGPQVQNVDNSFVRGQWNRLEVSITVPPNQTGYLDVRAYSAVINDQIWWDNFVLTSNLGVGMRRDLQPVAPSKKIDLGTIIENILTYAQDPGWGKSNLSIPVKTPATGQLLTRVYLLQNNTSILDALNEFPSAGFLDFAIEWDETGHHRWFRVYPKAKGAIKYNYPIEMSLGQLTGLDGAIDGSQTVTASRVLGQGAASGSSQAQGYAAFPSYLGGKVAFETATLTATSNVITTTADFFEPSDVGKGIYSLRQALPVGTLVAKYINPRRIEVNTPNNTDDQTQGAILSLEATTIGVGGCILDAIQTSIPDLPVGSLQRTAKQALLKGLAAVNVPAPHMKADAPNAPWGNLVMGDVVPVSASYGWLQLPARMMRLVGLTWYPVTEEVAPVLNVINDVPLPATSERESRGRATFHFSASATPTVSPPPAAAFPESSLAVSPLSTTPFIGGGSDIGSPPLVLPLIPDGGHPSGFAPYTSPPVGYAVVKSDDFDQAITASITSCTSDGTNWTITTSLGSVHAGEYVNLSGCSVAGYDGTYQIASSPAPSSGVFYINNTTVLAASSGGTAARWYQWSGVPGAGDHAYWLPQQGDTSTLASAFTITTMAADNATVPGVPSGVGNVYLAGGIGSPEGIEYGGVDVMLRRGANAGGTVGEQVGVALEFPKDNVWPQHKENDYFETASPTSNAMTYHWGPILTFTSSSGGTYGTDGFVPTNGSPVLHVSGGVTLSGSPQINSVTPSTSTTGHFTIGGGSATLGGTNQAVANSSQQVTESGIDNTQWHCWSLRQVAGQNYYFCDGVLVGDMTNPNIQILNAMGSDFQVEHEGTGGAPSSSDVTAGTVYDQTQIDWVVIYTKL